MYVTKSFDSNLHQLYDEPAKDIVKSFIREKLSYSVENNPNIYGVDLIIYKNDKVIGYAEVEMRNNWKTDNFPYDTLNVPYRKKKLLENDKPTFFFSINSIKTRMFCCDARTVLESEIKENPNKYVKSKELFYKIPIDKLKLYCISI